MQKTTKRPSVPECIHQLTMIVHPSTLDHKMIVTRQRLRAIGVRVKLIVMYGFPLDEVTGGRTWAVW